jgi:hypothetical protein
VESDRKGNLMLQMEKMEEKVKEEREEEVMFNV